MNETIQEMAVSYSSPCLLAEKPDRGSYGQIIWIVVAVSLVVLLGGLAICLSRGFDGIAFQVSIDNWTVKLGCIDNP